MKKCIFVINGTGGCGKDTFVNFISEHLKVKNFSSIDIIKEMAKFANYSGGKTEKDRKFLSDLKELTTNYSDLSFNSVKYAISEFLNSHENIMFIHAREPEFIQRLKDEFDIKTLLIKRDGQDLITSNKSDANVENFIYDYTIINTTLDQFKSEAHNFINILNLE